MDIELFSSILAQLQDITKEITFHIVGDPLVLSNLSKYLDISHHYGMKVSITTTGYYLTNFDFETFVNPAIKQINFSLNSYNKNSMDIDLAQYITPILEFSKYKISSLNNIFVNLRLWNIDESMSDRDFNSKIFGYINSYFDSDIDIDSIYQDKPKFIRVANKVRVHFDSYFVWPSIDSKHRSDGFCYGLKSHFGILSDGRVVPCCLDCDGVIELGDLSKSRLEDILKTDRTKNIQIGFQNGIAIEEFCKGCEYKNRFNET
jgi:radical SAM protein with 4Fe4S-binding SPASM domain